MRSSRYASTTMVIAGVVAFVLFGSTVHAQRARQETTLTGVVSDALCGVHHSMKGMSAADCTRMCVKAGQGYALVVGDKVYNLRGHSTELDKYAGQKVAVRGKLSTDELAVDSVVPAR